ncbi:MAG: DUF4417 domain-containing protein [Segatella sp.]
MTHRRTGIQDTCWNAFMTVGSIFTENDIPFCPTTANKIPERIITYKEARELYNKKLKSGDKDFHDDAFVCFYEDDQDFDSTCGIWFRSKKACRILDHFAGIITPDFSTYQDFPEPLKLWNTYRMRAFGYWYGAIRKKNVINNVRWGTQETYYYCFSGIPKNSIVAIGTVGGSPRKLIDRRRFEEGLDKLVEVLAPHIILVYGSANYPCFDRLKEQGITIISYPSKTCRAYAEVKE